MFLSRVSLRANADGRSPMRALMARTLSQVGNGHHMVWSLFDYRGNEQEREFLYRMHNHSLDTIWVLSKHEPRDDSGLLEIECRPNQIVANLQDGDHIRWSLRVNATVTERAPGTTGEDWRQHRGRRVCLVRQTRKRMEDKNCRRHTDLDAAVEAIPSWLSPRLGAIGLQATPNMIEVTDVVRRQFLHDAKSSKAPITMTMTDIQGVATVQDANLFKAGILKGIGRGGAYGAGMLMVAH